MKFKPLVFCALLGTLLPSASAETVIKILRINPQAKVRAIWQEAAQKFESAHPDVKVEFDYLENEAFKAKLPPCSSPRTGPASATAGAVG